MNEMQKTNEMRNEQDQMTSEQERESRQGRFDWIVSDFTIGLALLVLVTPAVYEGIQALNSLPVI